MARIRKFPPSHNSVSHKDSPLLLPIALLTPPPLQKSLQTEGSKGADGGGADSWSEFCKIQGLPSIPLPSHSFPRTMSFAVSDAPPDPDPPPCHRHCHHHCHLHRHHHPPLCHKYSLHFEITSEIRSALLADFFEHFNKIRRNVSDSFIATTDNPLFCLHYSHVSLTAATLRHTLVTS